MEFLHDYEWMLEFEHWLLEVVEYRRSALNEINQSDDYMYCFLGMISTKRK